MIAEGDDGHMDDRLRAVLCAIVEAYIETVEPVGSRTLSRLLDLGLSPATIRNVMADLTDQGYLRQPHTSAGRVPTTLAYRYYVDRCIDKMLLPGEVKTVIERSLNESANGLVHLLASTSKLLAGLTQFTGIVASPRVSEARLRQIEFLKIGERSIYAVLITQSNMGHHKIIETSEELSQEFLNSVSSYLNEQFAFRSPEEVRREVLESLVEEQESYDQMLAQAARLSKKAFDVSDERDLYVEGLSHIVNDFDDVADIRRLLKALEEKFAIIDLLDQTLEETGVNLAIGREIPIMELQECSLVTARYSNGDRVLGAIGVIGPTRMNYPRVIPVIDYAARMLSQAIASQ